MIQFKNKIIENTKELNLEELNKDTTLLVVVDMINGFIREGALASKRIESIVPEVLRIITGLDKAKRIFFVDEHEENCKEFQSFPPHCIKGSNESKIINELIPFTDGSVVIPKNSTNGYMTEEFVTYFDINKDNIKNIIVVGCCTDLCIYNYCISTLTSINELNLDIDVAVPVNAVETYDLFEHEADNINIFALYTLNLNGIKLCKFN